MRFHTILFDLDGTLLDGRATFRRHLELQVARHADYFDGRDAAAYVTDVLSLAQSGMLDPNLLFREAETRFDLPAGAAGALKDDFERYYPESCVPLHGAIETLEALRAREITLGMITNGPVAIQSRKIDSMGIRAYFDTIVISEAAGWHKPDPRIFRLALDQLGVPAHGTAFVGDNPIADVVGAKQSGLFSVWIRDDLWPDPVDADLAADDPRELLDHIDALATSAARAPST